MAPLSEIAELPPELDSSVFDFLSLPFEEKLDRFAQVAVRVGLNLQAGQELLISASTDMMPLVRRITEYAYKAGAPLVTTVYSDDEAVLARYKYAPDESFDKAAQWLADGVAAAFRSGAARLALAGAHPRTTRPWR
jgi:aminopeptidase